MVMVVSLLTLVRFIFCCERFSGFTGVNEEANARVSRISQVERER